VRELTWTVDGEELRGEVHPPAGPAKGAVVATHGFNSDIRELAGLPAALASRGWHVLALDQRGFGRSGGERGYTTAARAVADIRSAVDQLPKMLPVALVGHSLGGAYCLEAAAQDRRVRAVVAAHPVDRLFDELNPFEKLGYHLVGRVAERRRGKGKPAGSIPFKVHYDDLFADPAAVARARAAPFLQPRVNLGNYRNALTFTGSGAAHRVTVPALVLTSPRDKVVQPAHQRAVFEALPGQATLLEHDGGHSCFGDAGADRLLDSVAAWLESHVAPVPA
jgi:alpha-beta hydrolase superfamily lysophospholipase